MQRDTQLSWAVLFFHAILLALHLYRHVRFNIYACTVTIRLEAIEFGIFERFDNFTRMRLNAFGAFEQEKRGPNQSQYRPAREVCVWLVENQALSNRGTLRLM